MPYLTRVQRDQLNQLAIKGQHDAARCTERLLMDGETLYKVEIFGARVHIAIAPPGPCSPLWRDGEIARRTDAEVSWFAVRYGCSIHWTLARAEAELQRIGDAARRVH